MFAAVYLFVLSTTRLYYLLNCEFLLLKSEGNIQWTTESNTVTVKPAV